jgi:hypothetical protein
MLMEMVQDEPQRLKSESEKIKSKILANATALKVRVEAAERLSLLWKEYCEERKQTEEQLAIARAQYKDVLKRTEAAALSGQPRLYWFAKSMFAKLRKHSLEYQVTEARSKLEALQDTLEKLTTLARKLGLEKNGKELVHVVDFDASERLSDEHSALMSEVWQRSESIDQENLSLQSKLIELDIKIANSSALVAEAPSSQPRENGIAQPRVVGSDKMLTSRLPHLGFVNKTKLISVTDQSEYAAEHAERDLQKVRDGLRMASDAMVAGRATRTSREWMEYCKTIVCRYNEQTSEVSTPR